MGALIHQSSLVAKKKKRQHSATAATGAALQHRGIIICHSWLTRVRISHHMCCATVVRAHRVPDPNSLHLHVP